MCTYVGSISRISSLECPGNRHARRTRGSSSTTDADLRAANVELRRAARIVDGQTLDAKEILPVLDALRDVEGVVASQWPRSLSAREGRAPVVDLEPAAAAVIVGCFCGGLGHV